MTPKAEPAGSVNSFAAYRCMGLLAAGVFVLDQLSKLWVVGNEALPKGLYPPMGGIEIIPGFFNLVYTVNYGAAWGMFQGMGWLLVVLAVGVVAAIYLFRNQLKLRLPFMQFCFGLITGGILGNTVDRLFRGHVVDFLDVHLGFYRWPTFNLADSALVVGTFCFVFAQYFPKLMKIGAIQIPDKTPD